LNTQLTAAGAPLSQGQLARLVLARAIASRPRLLLIDGVLDGLHADTLQHVWSKIIEKPRPWTVIAVSNRDEISSKCDRVMHLTPVEEAAISAASH
jgi:putative ABC transport system ATP-binding protein